MMENITLPFSTYHVIVGLLLFSAIAFFPVYNLWFHPLARFPGPTLWTVSRLPYVRSLQRGDFHQVVKGFHDQYGPIVRLASNELSFIDAQAWQDIYAHHRQGKDFLKNTDIWFKPQPNGVHSIISVNDADHSRQRRLLAHAFSNKAFQTHEPILQYYINLMVSRLREKANSLPENTAIVDIVDWINFTTFDITGELSFGESFGCLKAGVYDPWISLFFQTFKAVTLGASTRFIPGMESIFRLMISKAALQKRQDHFKVVQEKVHKRVNREENMQKSDFMTYLLRHNDDKGVTIQEIEASFAIIVVAGAETTGTALTGTISYLIQSPESLSRLAAEVREAFKDEADITKDTVNKLPFLTAVIEEGLRLCPPTPAILPRVVPPEGAFVCGHWLPGNTYVSFPQFAAYRNLLNFSRPDSFLPSRWLAAPASPCNPTSAMTESVPSNPIPEITSIEDTSPQAIIVHKPEVFNPFSTGPRDCIGKSLAMLEMRLLIAKLVWNFDLVAVDKPYEWGSQKTYFLWEKKGLKVGLKVRV